MKVEIWSDVVCPWCYIGKRRFEAALADFAHGDQVEVGWRAFELDPQAPAERTGPLDEHLASKYGVSIAQARAMHAQMTGVAAAEGLTFRFDRARSGNTFAAHQLIHLGAERGVQDAVKERLLRAYLCDGERIGDRDTLVRLAAAAGLDPAEAATALGTQAYAGAVRAEQAEAAALGITGVPFFVIDRRYAVSGAQPAEVLRRALEQAWVQTQPLTMVEDAGAGCDGEGCAVPPAHDAAATQPVVAGR